jgi:hypothetical protein
MYPMGADVPSIREISGSSGGGYEDDSFLG